MTTVTKARAGHATCDHCSRRSTTPPEGRKLRHAALSLHTELSRAAQGIDVDGTHGCGPLLEALSCALREVSPGVAAALVDRNGTEIARQRAFGMAHSLVVEVLDPIDQDSLLAQICGLAPVSAPITPIRVRTRPARPRRAHQVAVPRSPLLTRALPAVDWSDAYAVSFADGPPGDPLAWADAVFHAPPPWVRVLFGLREATVRLAGIERGGAHAFDTLAWSADELLLGIDQKHLSFRASVLLEPTRVVVSTVVHVHNRRGRAYSALVRRIHPMVVRAMLSKAAREIGDAS